MNLLIYTHPFAPKTGGVETYVMLLATELARGKSAGLPGAVDVTVVTATPAGNPDGSSLPFRVVRQPGLLAYLRLLLEADVIHSAGPAIIPMLFGLVFRKPVVVEHSGYQAICPNGLLFQEPEKSACPGYFLQRRYPKCLRCNAETLGWSKSSTKLILMFLRRALAKRVDRNIAPSHHVARRIALPRTATIYHGISSLHAVPPAVVHGRDSETCFTYVGRLTKEKGVHLLFPAARELADAGYRFALKIVGDGPERGRLEAQAKTLGLQARTKFAGFLKGEALRRTLDDVRVVVIPSLWEEAAPLSAIEQMMCGRLVVAADTGGLGEFVDGAGLKFTPGNVSALAACLRRILDDPGLIGVLGEKARHKALNLFQGERMVAEHLRVYDECSGTLRREPMSTPVGC